MQITKFNFKSTHNINYGVEIKNMGNPVLIFTSHGLKMTSLFADTIMDIPSYQGLSLSEDNSYMLTYNEVDFIKMIIRQYNNHRELR